MRNKISMKGFFSKQQIKYLISIVIVAYQFLTAQNLYCQEWEKIEPVFDPPGMYHFFSGAFFDEYNGWAFDSENGVILNTTDGGLKWSVKRELGGYPLGDVFFLNDTTGWIIYSHSDTTVLLKTQNSGETWEEYSLHFYSRKLYFVDENLGFAYGDTNYCYRTINGGEEWQEFDISLPDTSVIASSIFFVNKGGWMITRNKNGAQYGTYLLETDDGGINWSIIKRLKDEGYTNIAFFDSLNGIITQLIGSAYFTDDGGNTWINTENTSNSSWELVVTDSNTAWTSGFGIHLTTDRGKTWQEMEVNTTEHLYDICFVDNSIGYAFGAYSTLLKYKNVVGITEQNHELIKEELSIESYPNPTNSASIVFFTLPQNGYTVLTLYNITGEKVKTIYEGYLSKGKHNYSLDLNNLSSGTYICTINQGNQSKSIKLLLLK